MRVLTLFLFIFSCPSIVFSAFNFSTRSATLSFVEANSSLNLEAPISNFSGTLNLRSHNDAVTRATALDTITFSNGILRSGNVVSFLSGNLDPDASDTIILNNGDFLDVSSGQLSQGLEVANGATATVYGQPKFSSDITINLGGRLELDISSQIDVNFAGSGTLYLLGNLTLGYGSQLPGLVLCDNNVGLTVSGGTYSSGVSFDSEILINFLSETTISGAWYFSESSTLNCNGNILNLSGSGSLEIDGGSPRVLTIVDAHIKGLSTTNFIKGNGEIRFRNCTIELNGSFVPDDGDYVFDGDNTKFIVNGETFTINTGVTFTVQGVILFYEQLDGSGDSPFIEGSGTITNPNLIREVGSGTVGGGGASHTPILIDAASSTTYSLLDNCPLTSTITLTFDNPDNTQAETVTFDGNGLFVSLPLGSSQPIKVDENVTVTFQDVLLKDFDHSKIEYLAVGADPDGSVVFGDDVYIKLGDDLTILSSDKSWVCTGNVTIDGQGNTLRIEKSSGITITGAKNLLFKNIRLEASEGDSIICLTDTASLEFQDVDFIMDNSGFTFATGSIQISNRFILRGLDATSATGSSTFNFTTSESLNVNTLSSFEILAGTSFIYNPDVSGDGAVAAVEKGHLTLTDPSSVMKWSGCNFDTGVPGMALNHGILEIENNVSVTTSSTLGKELELGSALNVNVASGAILDVDGAIVYQNTTFP